MLRKRIFLLAGTAGLAGIATMAACVPAAEPVAVGRAPLPPVRYVSVPVPPPRPLPRPRTPQGYAPTALVDRVAQLQRNFVGKAGIAIRAVDDGWTVEAGARQYLAQQSVSKLWVAMTVLDQRDQGRLRLDDPVTVSAADITLFHQPIAALAARPGGYRTTVGDLLTRALTQSDNTANDKLLWICGGPAAVRAMIDAKGLGAIRFGPGERLLQSRTAGLVWDQRWARNNGFALARARLSPATRAAALDAYVANPPDGAQPLAIADALARLARGDLLSETSTNILLSTMGQSVTGRARLRAAVPGGWRIAHKTGTGQDLSGRNAGFNDVGLLTAPDGRRYALAVMIGDTRRPIRERQQLIQQVAAAVAAQVDGRYGVIPGAQFGERFGAEPASDD